MSGKEQQQQRGRMVDRFIVIPLLSSTCRSASSVDVVAQEGSRHANKQPQAQGSEGAAVLSLSGGAGKAAKQQGEPLSLVARLLRGFKNLSQIFAVYDEEDEDEEDEQEMVIGLPTDVKHVAHIGWDGSTSTTTSVRSWNRAPPPAPSAAASTSSSAAAPPPEPQPPALSVRQFEVAMAAQASAAAAGTSTATASTSSGAGRHRHS